MTNDSQMEELRATAAAIAQEKATMDQRRDELLYETGKVLGSAWRWPPSALPMLVQWLPASGLKSTGPGGAGAVEERTFFLSRAWTCAASTSPEYTPRLRTCPRAQGGQLRGWGLGLLVDGRFVFLSQASTLSKHAEVASSWTAIASVLAPSEVGAAFKLAHLMEHFSKALAAHRRPDGVKRPKLELGKVRAVAQVLAGFSNPLG